MESTSDSLMVPKCGPDRRFAAAIFLLRDLAESSDRIFGSTSQTTIHYLRDLASMLLRAGSYEEAVEPARLAFEITLRALDGDHVATVVNAEVLTRALGFAGRPAEAETIWLRLTQALARSHPNHWCGHYARGQLGRTLAVLGRAAEAEPLLRASYDSLWVIRGRLPGRFAGTPDELAIELARVCREQGRPAAAAEWKARVAVQP
jgi:hypothetical protein